MIIELTHTEPFPFAKHYENLSKQRYFKKYFVKILGVKDVQLMYLGADVEADRAYLFNEHHKIEQDYEIEAWEPICGFRTVPSGTAPEKDKKRTNDQGKTKERSRGRLM